MIESKSVIGAGVKGSTRELFVVMETFYIMTAEEVKQLHTFVKTKNCVNLCKLYLNKASSKKRCSEKAIKLERRVLPSLPGKVSGKVRFELGLITEQV